MTLFRTRTPSMRIVLITLALFFVLAPAFVLAQNKFVPLTGVPGVDPNNVNLVGFLNVIYILSISLGALFAVIKIAIAGIKYTTSDIVTDKAGAKKDIMGALLGLAILLATYVVLSTINPALTNLNILGNAKPSALTAPPVVTPAAPGTTNAVGAVDCGSLAKYTADDGKVYCGKATTVDPTSAVPPAQQLTTAAEQCKADGGTLSPRSTYVTKPNADGIPTKTIVKQLICVK